MTCSSEAGYMLYRATTIMFQLFYDYKFLGKIKRKHVLPWQTEVKLIPHMKMGKYQMIDPDYMYMMKATPKKDLFQHVLPDNIASFWFFIKQHYISRKNRVIPTLE